MLCIAASRPLTQMEVHSRGHMEPIENRRLEATSDDETSANADFSGVKRRDLLLLRDKIVFLNLQLLDF
jgi:hypothetical protein